MRNEHADKPEIVVRPARARVDLGDESMYTWLKRRIARRRFAYPRAVLSLATLSGDDGDAG